MRGVRVSFDSIYSLLYNVNIMNRVLTYEPPSIEGRSDSEKSN